MDRSFRLVAAAALFAAAVSAQRVLHTQPGPAAGTGFGLSLAALADLDGDGARELLVGLPDHDAGPLQPDAGGVRVLSGRTGQLLRQTVGLAAGERLGAVLAGLGDATGDGVPDYATGNPLWSGSAGRVVLCSGADGQRVFTWTGENFSEFGSAIASAGDRNGDGRDDLVIGMPHNSSQTPLGMIRCYALGQLGHLWQATGTSDTQFGASIAAIGDVTGDGVIDLAVGEPLASANATFAGRVLLRDPRYGGGMGEVWRYNGFGQREYSGERVAAAGDCNGDGVPDVLASGRRGVFVVSGANGGLIRLVVDPAVGFGLAFDGIGDFDGDGDADFAVGSPLHNAMAGRVTIHDGRTGNVLLALDGAPGEQFGAQVTGLGDVDGDGRGDVAIGAPGASPGGGSVGRVLVVGHTEAAAVREYGAGCAGPLGVPDLTVQGQPVLGGSCAVRCGNLPSQRVGLWLFGLSDTSHAGAPLPLSLAPFGLPACQLLVAIDASALFATGAGNTAVQNFAAISGAFVGVDLFVQAALLDGSVAGGAAFSDAVALHFGNV